MPDPTRDPPTPGPTADPVRGGGTRTVGEHTPDPDGPPVGAAPPAAPPGYELRAEVGRGGMGVVYRARDLSLNRDVAVKILQDKYAPGSVAAARFVEEARITGQLQHPGIPPVHAVGTLPDGRPFLAMKLIKGDTLADLLAAGAGGRGELVGVFEQVCQAVAYAHTHGVIHRDLKPQNVMVGAFGEVQVMDWGLAKFRAEARTESAESSIASTFYDPRDDTDESLQTRAGSFLGTPAYTAPEQALGAVDRVDARSDVFGLGAVLCTVLTGEPPFVADTAEAARLLAAQGKLDGARARLDASGAEPELVGLCKRCLAADPADRPAHAGEVAAAIARLRAAAEERARTAELEKVRAEGEARAAEVRTAEQRKRRKVQAALGLTLIAAVGLAGFGFWWAERREADAAADRAARRSRTAASVSVALDDARVRTDEGWALADDPDKMRAATDLALAAVRRAEGFADAGEAPDETRAGLAAARAAAADLDRHTRLFVAADQILQGHDIGAEGRPAGEQTAGRLGLAFRAFGWDPVNTPAATIAAEIAASRVRNKVLGFLCDWEFQSSRDRAGQAKVRGVIRAARLRAGGLLAEWQRVTDAGDPRGLAAFATGPDVLILGPELLCALGRDLEAAGQKEARLALLRRATDRYPAHVWLNFDLMRACYGVTPARKPEGLRAAAAAATLRPDSALIQLNLASTYASLRETDLAVAHYRKVLALAPTYAAAYRGLATALTDGGDPDGAVAVLREYVGRVPGSAAAHNTLGDALFKRKDLAGAAAAFREAVRLDPKNAIHHSNRGITLKALGDLDGAAAAYTEVVRLQPANARAHNELGSIRRARGDLDAAAAAYREAARLAPQTPSYPANLGLVLREQGDPAGAAAAFGAAVRIDPTNARVQNDLAWLLATGPDPVRDGKRGVAHATRACQLTGWKTPSILDTLAAAHAAAGDFDRAAEYQRKALADPGYERDHGADGRARLQLYTEKKPYRHVFRAVAPPPRPVNR